MAKYAGKAEPRTVRAGRNETERYFYFISSAMTCKEEQERGNRLSIALTAGSSVVSGIINPR